MTAVDKSTVIGFGVVGCIGTSLVAMYYFYMAVSNQTGPKRGKEHMRDYSGRFEMDLLPIFVNGITAIHYAGECMEEAEGRFGFFNEFRFASYMLTCPFMIFELVSTIGGPYAFTMTAMTLLSILCSVFADLATNATERWAWFAIGSVFFFTLAFQIHKTQIYARKLNDELCGKCEGMNQDLRAMGTEDDLLPTHMLRIETPMDKARVYIEGALVIMWVIWPIFPVTFILEKTEVLNRDETQVIFACADLVCKTMHSIFLDLYKEGLRQTVFSYGFLDSGILHEIDVWDSRGVYHQLKALSRATYGDALSDPNSQQKRPGTPGLDFHQLLVANQRNQNVLDGDEGSDATTDQLGSPPKMGMQKRRSNSHRVIEQSLLMTDSSDVDESKKQRSEEMQGGDDISAKEALRRGNRVSPHDAKGSPDQWK